MPVIVQLVNFVLMANQVSAFKEAWLRTWMAFFWETNRFTAWYHPKLGESHSGVFWSCINAVAIFFARVLVYIWRIGHPRDVLAPMTAPGVSILVYQVNRQIRLSQSKPAPYFAPTRASCEYI